ncbi:MAG: VWA domain-containing protein, partial [Acidobacteriota bacterium]
LTGPLALSAERLLRPRQTFLLRLEVTEETTGKVARLSKGLEVASVATPIEEPPVAEEAIVAIDESLKKKRLGGADGLVLVPPISDVVFGLWRAEALVTGSAIERVKFLLDGKVQLSRRRPPFVAELRLDSYPKEQTIRAEGYDAEGNLVATDDIVLNQPRGELRVRIVDPKRGDKRTGAMTARVEVVVPEEKRVAKVELKVNEEVQAVLEQPPWEAQIEVPAFGELNYLTATAHLDDGLTAEDVRFLNSPQFVEEVNVDLVELFTTVTDRAGRIVYGLERGDFRVREDERPQNIVKFELVEDLPLTLGITIDTSGSMFESLGQAQRAAVDFLENIITPRDRTFAVAFSDQPEVLMQRTSDVGAVEARLESLVADGMTALHDAVVSSLYYYRGIRGRRALVLLSDGEDTASSLGFAESLEYARRSGVAIYTIGLRIGKADLTVRRKLDRLSGETGGRSFYIKEAEDLKDVYAEIERELRSQYLIAYNSDQDASQEAFRRVEVTVQDGKLEARTIGGYYP